MKINDMPKIECPYCGYDGSDLKIGRKPISNPMMCSKCRRYFNPFQQNDIEYIKTEILQGKSAVQSDNKTKVDKK